MTYGDGLVAARLEQWRGELLDLSGRNRLLHFTHNPRSRMAFRIDGPDPRSVFRSMVDRNQQFTLYREDDLRLEAQPRTAQRSLPIADRDRPATPGPRRPLRADEILAHRWDIDFDKNLDAIRRTAALSIQETGVNVLYLFVGLLSWTDRPTSSTTTKIRQAPIALIEVALERPSRTGQFNIRPLNDEVTYNRVLIEKLRREHDLGWEMPSDDLAYLSVDEILSPVHDMVRQRPDWSIDEPMYVGLLNFQKLSMFEDLERYRDQALSHPLVRTLIADEPLEEPPIDIIPARDLDQRVEARETFQILPADASQRAAIASANAGRTMIIQGPPGTGKSQTIANIIGEALAAGKRILFVSEKRAALDVVASRLAERDLSAFVLNLHGESARRADVLAEIRRAMESVGDPPSSPIGFEQTVQALDLHREKLDAYVTALHAQYEPIGWSVFDAYGYLTSVENRIEIDAPIPSVTTWSRARFDEVRELLRDMIPSAALIVDPTASPWSGTLRVNVGPADLTEIRLGLQDTTRDLNALAERTTALTEANGLPPAPTLDAARMLQALLQHAHGHSPLPVAWLTDAEHTRARSFVAGLHTEFDRIDLKREAFLARYDVAALDLDGAAVQQALAASSALPLIGSSTTALDALTADPEALVTTLATLDQHLDELIDGATALGRLSNIPLPTDLESLRQVGTALAAIPAEQSWPTAWLVEPDPTRIVEQLAQGEQAAARVVAARLATAHLRPDALGTIDDALRTRWAGYGFLRILSGQYRRDRAMIRAIQQTPEALADSSAATLIEQVIALRSAEHAFDLCEPALRALLGDQYEGITTDWAALRSNAEALRRIVIETPRDFRPDIIQILAIPPTRRTSVRALATKISERLAAINALAEPLIGVSPLLLPLLTTTAAAETSLADRRTEIARLSRPLVDVCTAIRQLLNMRTKATPPTFSELQDDALALAQLQAAQRAVDDRVAEADDGFGGRFLGRRSDLVEIAADLDWVQTLRGILGNRELPAAFARRVAGGMVSANEHDLAKQAHLIARAGVALEFLQTLFPLAVLTDHGDPLSAMRLEQISGLCGRLLDALPELSRWDSIRQLLERASELGLDPLLEAFRRRGVPAPEWDHVFVRRFATLWLNDAYTRDQALGGFTSERHDTAVDRFREADLSQLTFGPARVQERQYQKRLQELPRFLDRGAVDGPEWRELRKYANQKRPRRSLRDIFAESPQALMLVKPCLLMSPLSVSTFLAADRISFDLVLFDEASQVLPWDAIGAIMRGRQTIIVGDDKQLPPTRFFDRVGDDPNTDEETPTEFESVLELCASRLDDRNRTMLRYHYRSRDESLIAFSNLHYYDNRLVTFPNATATEPAGALQDQINQPGLHFVHQSNAYYEPGEGRRFNQVEANSVVELLGRLLSQKPAQSIGIVTLSKPQQELVQARIDERRDLDPVFDRAIAEARQRTGDEVFVKNLESVQGDEREIIILSIGYGRVRDAAGRDAFNFNFGPLNNVNGSRRLNVAVTRAREQLFVLSSMRGADIDLSRARSKGARDLAAFLTWAEERRLPVPGTGGPSVRPDHGGDEESPFEESVATFLEDAGYEIVRQVGESGYRIDLGVIHPDLQHRYLLGVECDGATYHATPTARDRDRLRQSVLEGLGWSFHRVWSTSWIRDRTGEEARLLAALESRADMILAMADGSNPTKTDALNDPHSDIRPGTGLEPPSAPVFPTEPSKSGTPHHPATFIHGFTPYVMAELKSSGREKIINAPVSVLIQNIADVVRAESPVHVEAVIQRIAATTSTRRLTEEIRGRLERMIASALAYGAIQRRGDFLWAISMTFVPVRGPALDGTRRPFHRIAQEEFDDGVRLAIEAGYVEMPDRLTRAVAAAFGIGPVTPVIAQAVTDALARIAGDQAYSRWDDIPF